MTWNIQEILKNVENEKCSLWDLEYDEKTETHGNENGHFWTWDMARNTENVKNEKCTL